MLRFVKCVGMTPMPFGKFEVKEKNARRGRNPQTGDDLMLGARRVVTFSCYGLLRDKLNGKS
ncbi:MAG: HU family DNA-binding protein [Deltaproteobacteria bacterium]|nr:HU family DNA-binding protein [Deltaproteobacteria bacterium]